MIDALRRDKEIIAGFWLWQVVLEEAIRGQRCRILFTTGPRMRLPGVGGGRVGADSTPEIRSRKYASARRSKTSHGGRRSPRRRGLADARACRLLFALSYQEHLSA